MDRPAEIGEWSISQIIAALSRPLPEEMLSTKQKGGETIRYCTWPMLSKCLDKYAPGWEWDLNNFIISESRIFLSGALTIVAADGSVRRSACGTEVLKQVGSEKEIAYGDPASNAEAQAFRRACAKFGLGRALWCEVR